MSVAYVCDVELRHGTGGGVFAFNVALALAEARLLKLLVCRGLGDFAAAVAAHGLDDLKVIEIKPEEYGLPHHPYVWDYLVSLNLDVRYSARKSNWWLSIDVWHFFGGTYWLTYYGVTKNVVDVPAHDLKESIKEWETMLGNYPFKHMKDPRLFELYCHHIKHADAVVTPSLYSAEQLKKLLDINPEKIHVICHGCYPPEKVTEPPSIFPRFLSVGHLGPDKGHIYLLKAWELLGQPLDAGLTIVGKPGPMLQNPGFRKLLHEPGLRNVDWIPEAPDLEPLYGESYAYVQPSVTEGFGLPVLEAAAYGRPVIVSETAGASELFEHEVHGFKVPPRSPEKLAEAMRYLLEDPDAAKQMGRRAAERARKYTWEHARENYKKLYEWVMRK